ncbi:hypothetical protein M3Y97_00890700 [Aphelenchoides bicaudatus]|nr:hypothetical protein M3Y97_00890700 [Aphelenchoides bicaudatus]
MPHRILRQLLNDPRVIQQMADSWPMRRAAKFTVQTYHKALHRFESTDTGRRLLPGRISSFMQRFRNEYRKALEEKK